FDPDTLTPAGVGNNVPRSQVCAFSDAESKFLVPANIGMSFRTGDGLPYAYGNPSPSRRLGNRALGKLHLRQRHADENRDGPGERGASDWFPQPQPRDED